MTTPLQKAAQAVIAAITDDEWIEAYEELRKALDAEIAQSVEPNTPDKEKAEYGHDNSVPEGYRTPYYCGVCSEHCGDVGSPQEVPLKIHARCHSCEEAQSVEPDFRKLNPSLWAFFHQLIHGDFMADNPSDLNSALRARQEVFELCANAAPPQPNYGWLEAVDKEMVCAHLGVANITDTFDEANAKLLALINWHVAVATDPAVNGGLSLQPHYNLIQRIEGHFGI